jgi:multisubunit Na+/H+ antiporter MnhG subunit
VSAREWIALVLLAGGVIVEAICCLGLVVMRDTLDRLHYVAPGGIGVALIALAVLVEESWSLIADKALAIAFFLLLVGPVLGHVTARTIRIRERDEWQLGPDEDVEVER